MIYDFTVKDSKGKDISLEKYRGKVMLIVNTATHCGFTPQYEGLQALYTEFKDKGFEILDFPSNQFASQTPESDDGIYEFCTLHFGTTFDRYAKIDVNGDNAIDLYKYLRAEAPYAVESEKSEELYKLLADQLKFSSIADEIKWNFTKFLVDKKGNVIQRFAPTETPEEIRIEIEKLL